MRDVARFGEWRHRNQRDAHPKLIESRTTRGIRSRRIGSQRRAQSLGVKQRRVGSAGEVVRALRSLAGLLAVGRERQVFALSGIDSVWSAPFFLGSGWRLGVIVESTMLIVKNKDNRVLPERPVADRVHDLRDMVLPTLDVSRRMLVVFQSVAFDSEVRVDERNLRQRAHAGGLKKESG